MDSLKGELFKPHGDSVTVSLCQEIGYHLLMDSPAVARQYFFKAYQLCIKNNYRDGIGVSLTYMAMSWVRDDELDSAHLYLKQALDFFKDDTSTRARANYGSILNELANVEKAQGKLESAISLYLESLNITMRHETNEKYYNIAIGYYNVALVFEEMKDFKNAMNYGEQAISASKIALTKTSDTSILSLTHSSMALMRLSLIHYLLELDNLDEAFKWLQKQHDEILGWNNNNMNAFLFTEWGNYYTKTGSDDMAIKSYKKALHYASGIDNRKILALRSLGRLYKKNGNYEAAEAAYRQILHTRQAQNKLQIKAQTVREIAEILLMNKKFRQSAQAFAEYNLYADSLNILETRKQIQEIENKYQVKQKQDSILMLQKNNRIQSLSLSKRRNLNYGLISGIGILLFIGILVYRNMKHRHLILKQAETLNKEQIQKLEKEHQLVAAQSLMKGEEAERSRLARDLHDGVGGLLSGVKLSLSTMKGNVFLSENNARSVETIIHQLDNSINELRRVSHNMMPEALIRFGLRETLENYCERINQTGGLRVRFQTYGTDQRMRQDTEIALYRIVQELMNNVIRHARAENVLIQLTCEEARFSLTVEDDGRGFDLQTARADNHAGINNVQSRASLLNGSVDINTAPGKGTSVTIIGKC